MKKRDKFMVCSLIVTLIILVLSAWTPWQRQPEVFYAPFIFPLETVAGDVIVFEDGFNIVIEEDKRINSIQRSSNKVTINATVHRNLWQILAKNSLFE